MFDNYDEVYKYLVQKKCKDIALYDLTNDSEKAVYMFVVSNPTPLANKKFADFLIEDLKIADQPDGYSKGEWIIFEFGNFIIHSFVPLSRDKYNLDKLWKSRKINLKKKK